MSEVPSSAIIICIAIIITAVLLSSVYVLTGSMNDTGNSIVSQVDEEKIQIWQNTYAKYDGETISGGNLIGLIEKSYKQNDGFKILVQKPGETTDTYYDFSAGDHTPAERLNTAKEIIKTDTMYKGKGDYTDNGTLVDILFAPVTVSSK